MKLIHTACAFIPRHINNAVVTGVWDLFARLQRLSPNTKKFSGHLKANEDAFKAHADAIQKADGYIEDQNNYTDMAYGKTTMQYAGCVVFAAYNAIRHLTGDCDLSLPRMIAEFERDGIVLSGRWGTSPKAVHHFLKRHGFQTVMTTNRQSFAETARAGKSLILIIYNNENDIRDQLHAVHVSKENGRYTAHNVYRNGRIVGPCDSLEELMSQIHDGRSKILVMIGIQ